jgi:rRNA-processing protein FCF1
MKYNIIFDSHIYDLIADGSLDITLLLSKKEDFEFYITHIQIDEINKCPNEEKRASLLLVTTKLSPKIIPTESMVWDISRWGECKWGDGKQLENLRQGNPSHAEDALIGETVIKNKLILVTNDKTLYSRVNANGGKAINSDEFKEMLR